MNRVKDVLLLLAFTFAVCLLVGCTGGSTSTFTLHTFHLENGLSIADSFVYTDGYCADCLLNEAVYSDSDRRTLAYQQTNSNGDRVVSGKYVNVRWTFARYSGPCSIRNYPNVFVGDTYKIPLECAFNTYFNTTPANFDVNVPPSSITFSGDAVLNVAHGMPVIDFYDEGGTWIGTTPASSVSNDGTSLSITPPTYLLSQYSGSYVAVISNINEDYTTAVAAAAAVNIYGNDPPPPPQCDCDMTCEEYEERVDECRQMGGRWLSGSCICQAP